MAFYSGWKSIYNAGKMALNSAIDGAKTILPYVKSALPIVSKIANGLSYVPIIGTAASTSGQSLSTSKIISVMPTKFFKVRKMSRTLLKPLKQSLGILVNQRCRIPMIKHVR